MASIQSLSIIGVLVALVPAASVAMPQDVPAEVKSCKAISDDRERLKCFDGLFGGPSKSQTPLEEKQVKEPAEKKQVKESSEEKQGNWSIDESKSPTDGSPQVVAANLVNDIVLILRCKEQTTEAAFQRNTIISATNLLMYNCESMTRIQSNKSGRHRWMVGLHLPPTPSRSFSHCRIMESCL